MFSKFWTKNYTKVPLFWVTFNYQLFKQGEKNNCMLNIHSALAQDQQIKKIIFDLIDYVRNNYDMEKLI